MKHVQSRRVWVRNSLEPKPRRTFSNAYKTPRFFHPHMPTLYFDETLQCEHLDEKGDANFGMWARKVPISKLATVEYPKAKLEAKNAKRQFKTMEEG